MAGHTCAGKELRVFLDMIPCMVLCGRADGSVELQNQRWLAYTGFSASQTNGWGWTASIHPEDLPRMREKWRAILKSGEAGEAEGRLRRFDGQYRWFLFRVAPLRDELGKLIKWYGACTDIEDRKGTEDALRRSEAYLAEAERLSHTGSWAYEIATGVPVYWSSERCRISEFDPAKGHPTLEEYRSLHAPEDWEELMKVYNQAIQNKTDFCTDTREVLPDGTARFLHIVGHPVLDVAGEVVELVGSTMDVTSTKLAKTLLAGEKRLFEMVAKGDSLSSILTAVCRLIEELFGGSLSCVSLLDQETNQFWISAGPSLPNAYVEAVNRLPGRPLFPACAYPQCPVIVSEIETDPLWTDVRAVALACDLRTCWSSAIVSHENRVLGNCALFYRESRRPNQNQHEVIEQITRLTSIAIERKRGEDALRRSEACLAEAQKLSHTGSFGWNVSTEKLSWSAESFRIFDYDHAIRPTANLLFQRVHPDDLDRVRQAIACAAQEEKDWDLECRLLMPNASVKYLRVVAHALEDELGKIEFVGALMDITERKKAEEALRKAQADLAHVTRLTVMGELTTSIAHEVNQPLAAVATNANACLRWLDRESPNLNEALKAVRRIVRDAKRGGDVIARIRALLRKTQPPHARLNINDVVRDILMLTEADLRGAILQIELASKLPRVCADRIQLQQVLLNLIVNAIDAMKSVTDRPHVLRIRTQTQDQEALLVTIQDTGVGLDPKNTEQLFEPFYTTKPKGLGMGLSISRSIVEAHGGHLWAEAGDGPGAIFRFTLPYKEGETA
jgi:PAS domain S-box-containing protein